jgi:hypothetical protein
MRFGLPCGRKTRERCIVIAKVFFVGLGFIIGWILSSILLTVLYLAYHGFFPV